MSKAIKDILSNEHKFKEVVRVAFDSVDTDRSGYLEKTELNRVMNQIATDMGAEAPSEADVEEVLNNLDQNGDGKLSFDDFSVLIRDVLKAMLDEEDQ